jgi:hypothetical protein
MAVTQAQSSGRNGSQPMNVVQLNARAADPRNAIADIAVTATQLLPSERLWHRLYALFARR